MPSRRHRLALAVVATAARLTPAALRPEWRREWRAELDTAARDPRTPLVRHAFGAFADAFWLRQRHVADLDWIDDLRYGWRQLTAHAGFALTAMSILAVGVGAAIAMFSVTDQILLRPLPYPDADRLVTIWETRADAPGRLDVAPANFLDWRDRVTSFETFAAATPIGLNHTGGDTPEVFFGMQVTAGFFEAFAVRPLYGRLFTPDEYTAGRHHVMLVHERLWRQRFGGDPSVVGQTFTINGARFTLVGIVPESFEPRLLPAAAARHVWVPKVIQEWEPRIRTSGYWNVVARLRPGVSLDEAQAELAAISAQLAREHPRTNEGTGAVAVRVRDHLVGDVRGAFGLLAAAVALVLLIACVNVASLLLARGVSREREVALRIALGASRPRVVRQLLVESLVIAVAGTAAGVWLAHAALRGIVALGPASIPWIDTLRLDGRGIAFAAGLAVVVALLSGLLPALRSAHGGLAWTGGRTTTAGPGRQRLRSGLVIAEVALAFVLLAGAGLLVRSFVSLLAVETGFSSANVLALQVFAEGQQPTAERRARYAEDAVARLAALPGVEAAGAVMAMPFIEVNINVEEVFTIASQPPPADGEAPRAYLSPATPGAFHALRLPLRGGRLFDERDRAGRPPVAVISDTLAARYWPEGRDPIGDRLTFDLSGQRTDVEVVGIVGAMRHDGLTEPPRPEIFLPHAQAATGSLTFVARTTGDPRALIDAAKAAIWEANPQQPIYRVATLDELVGRTLSPRRFALAIIVGFALVALLLAGGGVYGVLSAVIAARRREMGVRVALGATRADLVRSVVGRGLLLAGAGTAVGLAATLGAGRLLERFLFGVTAHDGLSVTGAGAALALAATAASYLPARRAASADPIDALRTE
ncbi:MAG: ABC transporter permease [Acidobacteriota bacterium]